MDRTVQTHTNVHGGIIKIYLYYVKVLASGTLLFVCSSGQGAVLRRQLTLHSGELRRLPLGVGARDEIFLDQHRSVVDVFRLDVFC